MNATVNTLGKLCEFIKIELMGIYPEHEINSLTDIMISELTAIPKHEIHIDKERPLNSKDRVRITEAVKELKTGKPLQYIIGYTDFYGLKLTVNPDVLIPRPETEELVKWIIDDHGYESLNILDIGTGSGCIAIALKKFLPNSTVFACDVSLPALKIARENAIANGVHIVFFQLDIAMDSEIKSSKPTDIKKSNSSEIPDLDQEINKSYLSQYYRHDIIAGNPPYIPISEKPSVNINVRDFEPANALWVPDEDPLIFYRHIALFGLNHLKNNGQIYVEIYEKSGHAVKKLFEELGYWYVTIRKDINGKDRMIKCFRQF